MKLFKTISVLILVVLLITTVSGISACSDNSIKIYLPDGTPALAVANIMDSNASFSSKKTTFTFVPADFVSAAFNDGADIAVMPTVVAAKLYSNGAKIKLLSTNIFGNLFIMGVNNSATNLEGLKGKVVYTTIGTTISLFKYLLTENQIEFEEGSQSVQGKVTLNSYADASSIIPMLKLASTNKGEAYGVLGEPQVTKSKQLITDINTVIDFQAEWQHITDFEGYPQASIVASDAFCKTNANYISKLLTALEGNLEFLNQNYSNLPDLFARFDSNLKNMTFTADTITNCNIRFVNAQNIKSSVIDYITRLEANTVINDNFFYSA